jgi:chitinase
MKKQISFARATLFIVLFATTAPLCAQQKTVAYVPNWIDLKAFAETIEYSKITHANSVQVLVSIGGGSASENKKLQHRYFNLIGQDKRAGFVAKLAGYITEHHFDGLDVDLEGPAINADYGAFVQDLSVALKSSGKLLTAALSQGYGGKNVPDAVLGQLDYVNIMAYDAAGPWDPKAPGQHSSLDFAKSSVAYWVGRGLPKSKAVLGVPFYGYGFGAEFRKGGFSFAAIVSKFQGAENVDQIGNTIWYNGIPTIKAKANYVVDEGLAGVMIWSLDNDSTGDKSLLSAIAESFGAKAK